ncbi:lipoyl(octanoyl) transferase LipB [Verticiella sediminum]|uniref:Octanoyltransferase n=1 Tax=Verticiella sediminum TaxID=1247510 RepID=A0A556AQ85_9BURK|nr:lipoyl(octanoyl) transferase LipB [Verticiella sediminum]TSH95067.1 lipoyl(octanoyl) transferase LipB [Verticiella sediminum]
MQRRWLTPRPAPYQPVWEAMRAHTSARRADTPDEIWLGEHAPVYTLGLAGKREHLLATGEIPVVPTDRGGQVTYHGPGQVMAYVLFDLRRSGYFVREYVYRLESAIIDTLAAFGIEDARREPGAPGVYVPHPDRPQAQAAKIAALGIKVSNGCTYHGVSLNVDMDLSPFDGINPCGYAGLATVDMAGCGVRADLVSVGERLADALSAQLTRRDR